MRCLSLIHISVTTALIEPDIVVIFVKIIFVLDVADDLFENVFDGDQAADTGVFVEHHRYVVVRYAELAQQHIQPLGLGDEDGRTQPVAQAEFPIALHTQKILRQQQPDNVVAIAIDHREA